MTHQPVALDIGGANLKLSNGLGWARCRPFPLWRNPDGLAGVLAEELAKAPQADRLVVTMTGELADCFHTKEEGVLHILKAVEQVAQGQKVQVYLVDGRLVSLDEARENPLQAAASNWHALAQFVCRFLAGKRAVLVDIGSTTTDLVPLAEGRPSPEAVDDTERMVAGELVYTGIMRTPVCAMTPWLPWRGKQVPVAAEVFATSADAYVTLGEIEEVQNQKAPWTADGRPLTVPFAQARLARAICTDATRFSAQDARLAAEHLRSCQIAQIRIALTQVVSQQAELPECVVISGAGEFLARQVVSSFSFGKKVISLAETMGQDERGKKLSESAPAYALALLAQEAGPS